jgi:hypothetical protein
MVPSFPRKSRQIFFLTSLLKYTSCLLISSYSRPIFRLAGTLTSKTYLYLPVKNKLSKYYVLYRGRTGLFSCAVKRPFQTNERAGEKLSTLSFPSLRAGLINLWLSWLSSVFSLFWASFLSLPSAAFLSWPSLLFLLWVCRPWRLSCSS